MEENKTMLSDALRIVRLYWGYSQSELAEILDVSQSMISEIESGSKSVSMDLLFRYSERLGIRLSQLLFFAEELSSEPARPKGKLLIVGKVLRLLEAIAPREPSDAA